MVSVLFLSNCKKNNTGGTATVILTPKHHDDVIFGTTVYVKFNATELPTNPTSDYDLKIMVDSMQSVVTISDLRYGDYYFYGEGYDPAIKLPVKGGIGLSIKWSDRKEEIRSDLPITE